MNQGDDSLQNFLKLIQQANPKLIDLMSAKSDDEFDEAFLPMLAEAVSDLENNSKNFILLDEEGLTAALKGYLKNPFLTVTQEENSNGHVDLVITASCCSPAIKRLFEAKIYDGYKYHISGLEQILTRYSTGRYGSCFLIIYCQLKNINGLIGKLKKTMDSKLPLNQVGKTESLILKWSFLSKHSHSSGEILKVHHVGCNMYQEDREKIISDKLEKSINIRK